ncbi:hypothetical protein Tco_0013276 [Tanacetum coccineum]
MDVHSRFGFSLYGYFVGQIVAFSVVEYYEKNARKKFGLVHVMMNANGFFFFKFSSIEGMNKCGIYYRWIECDGSKLGILIMLDSYTSSMCLQLWERMYYAYALIDIRDDNELKEDMVIVIPNIEDDGEVHFKLKKPIWQAVSKKNSASSSGLKKNYEVSRKNKNVVQDVVGSASSSPSNTPLVARINELESQMIKGKLVLLDDDGQPLKLFTSTLPSSFNVVSEKADDVVNEDNDSEVEEAYDETATYMASMGFNVYKASKSGSGGGNKSLYE